MIERSLIELEARLFAVELVQETGRHLRAGADPLNYSAVDFVEEIRPRQYHKDTDSLADAHGLLLLCPLCFERAGTSHVHAVIVPFDERGCPVVLMRAPDGKPVYWKASGTGLKDLVLTPSVRPVDGCCWHGFIGSGGVKPGHAR